MSNVLKQSGTQSATYLVPTVGEIPTNGTLTVLDWANLPKGKLKNLLNKSYATVEPLFNAMAEAGFSGRVLHINGDTAHKDITSITLDGAGYPVVSVVTADIGPYIASFQTSYSASE